MTKIALQFLSCSPERLFHHPPRFLMGAAGVVAPERLFNHPPRFFIGAAGVVAFGDNPSSTDLVCGCGFLRLWGQNPQPHKKIMAKSIAMSLIIRRIIS